MDDNSRKRTALMGAAADAYRNDLVDDAKTFEAILEEGYAPPGYRIARGLKEEQAERSKHIPWMLADLKEKEKDKDQ